MFTFFGWIANNLMALHLAMMFLNVQYQEKLEYVNAFKLGFVAAFVGVVYDLFTDPAATALKVWVWSYEGPWFGVPTGNFIGWFVILSSSSIGYHLTVYYGKSKMQRIILAIISVIVGSLCVAGTMSLCMQLGIR
ncbi:MAG: carotenoid biosynthesis protein [Candidatus Asgardarchaeia archaeon]